MATRNCEACESLRQDAPSIVNGFDEEMCASLMNNTGLNPSSGNDNCEDLNNLVDCLIGNEEAEVDLYEVCDWKTFMKQFIGNIWTTLKGIVCAVCGMWSAISTLSESLESMCELQARMLSPQTLPHGILPHNTETPRYGGVIAQKSSKPVLIELPQGDIPDAMLPVVGVGVRYSRLQSTDCLTGDCVLREWYAPYFYGYKINDDVELAYLDELWSIDKASVLGRWGFSQAWWDARAAVPIGWESDFVALGTALVGVRMSIESDRLVLRYYGQIGAASHAALSGHRLDNPADGGTRIQTSSC